MVEISQMSIMMDIQITFYDTAIIWPQEDQSTKYITALMDVDYITFSERSLKSHVTYDSTDVLCPEQAHSNRV